MTVRDFLNQYDIEEGDFLECEDGEVYMILKSSLGWMLAGPQPFQYIFYFHGKKKLTKTPKRLLRPRWKGLDTNGLVRWLHLEVLQPKQQRKPTITVNVPKGVKVEVVENE